MSIKTAPWMTAMLLLMALPAEAYVGPGVAITLLGAVGALLASIGLALWLVLSWPIRRWRAAREARRAQAAAAPDAATPDAPPAPPPDEPR